MTSRRDNFPHSLRYVDIFRRNNIPKRMMATDVKLAERERQRKKVFSLVTSHRRFHLAVFKTNVIFIHLFHVFFVIVVVLVVVGLRLSLRRFSAIFPINQSHPASMRVGRSFTGNDSNSVPIICFICTTNKRHHGSKVMGSTQRGLPMVGLSIYKMLII